MLLCDTKISRSCSFPLLLRVTFSILHVLSSTSLFIFCDMQAYTQAFAASTEKGLPPPPAPPLYRDFSFIRLLSIFYLLLRPTVSILSFVSFPSFLSLWFAGIYTGGCSCHREGSASSTTPFRHAETSSSKIQRSMCREGKNKVENEQGSESTRIATECTQLCFLVPSSLGASCASFSFWSLFFQLFTHFIPACPFFVSLSCCALAIPSQASRVEYLALFIMCIRKQPQRRCRRKRGDSHRVGRDLRDDPELLCCSLS